ncbi:protein disulfide isomerase, putative [Plasmodium sp. gorilla clade G2]|uniref:protein disulfide isomerase, putative n=1 Tax=Plasmodium sp. gorilla clade G2 TaxID=880535 RepID=UPI000D20F115|nr:protein disulfide isomerase, putative [Plasmodium sp. gorilla clade G2]SOV15765.1 protein disulfide isomerase, putative [Plasmodium sp. gorilla clade G2]
MIIKFLIFNLLLCLFRCNTKVNLTYPQYDFLKMDSENISEALESNTYWFINFYAPQCVYCKYIWDKLRNIQKSIQNENRRKIYFAEINCDNPKAYSLCEIYGALKVPQLKMFRNSALISTYSNDITNENSIKSWIYYVTTPIFVGVQNEDELKSYETENNMFLTCSENLPDDLFDVAKLYYEECYFINITNPDMCTKMNIKANELHVKSAYNHSTYDLDKLDPELLKSFINKNRFPLLMKIDHRNFFNIRSSGNNLMLLLLDMKKNFDSYISEYKRYAEKYKNQNDILFGYIDGKYYEENLELYGTNSDMYPQIILFSKYPKLYYFEEYFNIDNVDNIIDDLKNKRIYTKLEEFTKFNIIMIKLKKHIRYILKKAFKTDVLSFIGFICSVIMILCTAILVIHTIYRYYISYTKNNYTEKENKTE